MAREFNALVDWLAHAAHMRAANITGVEKLEPWLTEDDAPPDYTALSDAQGVVFAGKVERAPKVRSKCAVTYGEDARVCWGCGEWRHVACLRAWEPADGPWHCAASVTLFCHHGLRDLTLDTELLQYLWDGVLPMD